MLKLNLGSGRHPLEGFINLDRKNGWLFQNKLSYKDNEVDGVTISHLLMYIILPDLYEGLKEIHRVLKSGGVLRITEDNTTDPESEVYGGYRDALILTDAKMVRVVLEKIGFKVYDVNPEETHFVDESLIQQFHGKPPRVFHIEGIKK